MEICLSYQVANLQGIGARLRQEDAFTFANAFDVTRIQQNGMLFLVCDGMGGMRDGKLASETAVASIREEFQTLDVADDIPAQLADFLTHANDKVYALLNGAGGTTAAGGVIYQEKLWFFSVGDSFLYLKRGEDLIVLNRPMNVCHEVYMDSILAGEMTPFRGKSNPEAEALTGFLGMDFLSDIDRNIRPFPLYDGDVLLAASDGIGGTLDMETVAAALSAPHATAMCDALEHEIARVNKPNQDNYTALVVNCMY